jgi:hypothetical protein
MGLDIRIPIGLMFAILGGVLAVYGLGTGGSPMYARNSLGINVNLWWGVAMLLFGVLMVLFGKRTSER